MSRPRVDAATNIDVTHSSETEAETNFNYSFFAAQDLLYMTGKWFFSGNKEDSLSSLRLTLERRDANKNLTPLKLSNIEVGDTFSNSIPLLMSNQSGRGVSINNFPLNSVREFNKITLRDDLQVGWQAELYRGEALIGVQTEPNRDGRYEFEDIKLFFGQNDLKVVLHGPQGQRREIEHEYFIGGGAVAPGEHFYSFSVIEQGVGVFDELLEGNSDDDFNSILFGDLDQSVDATFSDINSRGGVRAVFEYETGLTNLLALKFNHGFIDSDIGTVNVSRVGLVSSYGAVLSELSVASVTSDSESIEGAAVELSQQFKWLGLHHNVNYQRFFSGFSSEVVSRSNNVNRILTRSRYDVVGFLPQKSEWLPNLSYSFGVSRDKYDSGGDSILYSNRLSTRIKNVAFTNNLSGGTRRTGGNQTENLSGSFLFSLRNAFNYRNVSLRGGVNYRIKPESVADSLFFNTNFIYNPLLSMSVGLTHSLQGEEISTLSYNLTKRSKYYALSFNSRYSTTGFFSAGLGLDYSFDASLDTSIYGERIADKGKVVSRVFLDHNANGVFDEGDEAIEGAAIKISGVPSKSVSKENGFLEVPNLTSYKETDVTLDLGSLEDAYWVPMKPGKNIVPRPGSVARVDFALVNTGELEGYVTFRSGDKVRDVAGMLVSLYDLEGNFVKKTKSAYDGFYLLTGIKPGKYELRVEKAKLEKVGIKKSFAKSIEVTNDGGVLSGLDFALVHPDTQDYIDKLRDHRNLEYYERALALMLKVDKIIPPNLTFGKEEHSIFSAFRSGKYHRAISYYEKALSVVKSAHGEQSEYVARSYNNLGASWFFNGRTRKAKHYFQRANAILKKLYGHRHKTTSLVSNNLLKLELYQSREFLAFYEDLVDKTLRLSDPPPNSFRVVKNRIRQVNASQKVKAENARLINDGLASNNLVSNYLANNNDEPIRLYNEAYILLSQKLNREPRLLANCLNNIGVALYHDGRYLESLNFFDKASALLKEENDKQVNQNVLQDIVANLSVVKSLSASIAELGLPQG